MKVLIIGAGVIGSLFAGRLQISGHEVVMLARGIRLEQIRTQGLVFEDQKTEIKNVLKVQVVDQINQNDHFELAIISVRKIKSTKSFQLWLCVKIYPISSL